MRCLLLSVFLMTSRIGARDLLSDNTFWGRVKEIIQLFRSNLVIKYHSSVTYIPPRLIRQYYTHNHFCNASSSRWSIQSFLTAATRRRSRGGLNSSTTVPLISTTSCLPTLEPSPTRNAAPSQHSSWIGSIKKCEPSITCLLIAL